MSNCDFFFVILQTSSAKVLFFSLQKKKNIWQHKFYVKFNILENMKKIFTAMVIIATLMIAFVACNTYERCPAYTQVESTQQEIPTL